MDKRMTLTQYQEQRAYVEQLQRALTLVVYRSKPLCRIRAAPNMRRPRTWQAIPGVSRLYSLN